MVGEVYNYGISGGKEFDFGDKKVNYFEKSFNALINFELKYDAIKTYDSIFVKYDSLLNSKLKGFGTLNYLTSHDDGQPFNPKRIKKVETANILYLTPGASQTYYGDESARDLIIDGTQGDATLRSFMNWDSIQNSPKTKEILIHWQKLGKFRNQHPAVGAGRHLKISDSPYVFSRTFFKGDFKDKIVVGSDLEKGEKEIKVSPTFKDGMKLHDVYSNKTVKVENGMVIINSDFTIVLLEAKKI